MSLLLSDLFGKNKETTATGNNSVDITVANFQKEVLEGSLNALVLLDFWAPWCGPCKTLTPLLEKLSANYKGKVKLAKINIDQQQQLAMQFRIQSVPTVIAFFQGRPVDAFMGALPESQIRQFIEKIVGPADQNLEELKKQALALINAQEYQQALGLLQAILSKVPEDLEARISIARCYAFLGDLDSARAFLGTMANEPAAQPVFKLIGLLELAQDVASHSDQDPIYDLYKSALSAFALGNHQTCIDGLLTLIKQQRDWRERLAETTLFNCFTAIGHDHPLSLKGRRQLASILYV